MKLRNVALKFKNGIATINGEFKVTIKTAQLVRILCMGLALNSCTMHQATASPDSGGQATHFQAE